MKTILFLATFFFLANTVFAQQEVLTPKGKLSIFPNSGTTQNNNFKSEKVPDKIPEDTKNPIITCTSPANFPFTSSEPTITLAAKASDESGIYQILLNDSKVTSPSFSKTIKLVEGENVFTITAVDKKQNEAEKTIKIIYKPKRKDYALLFYVSEYGGATSDLTGTKKNAEKLAKILTEQYNFEVKVFPNYRARAIKKVLIDYKQKIYSPDDQLLIYFSGHGEKIKAINEDDEDTGSLLCAEDTDISHHAFKTLSKNNCNHTLLVLDACFSGLLKNMALGDKIISYEPTKEEYLSKLFEHKSFRVLTSGEAEGTIEDNGLSDFTAALADVLQNESGKSYNVLTYDELKLKILARYPNLKEGKFNRADEAKGTFLFIKK